MTPIPASKCTSPPDCPCDFCTGLRVKAFCYRRDREMDAERAEENQIAEDFLRWYSQTTLGDTPPASHFARK
jgi:hypothetical protein